MGYLFESYVCVFQRLQLCVKFDIHVWLEWALPCPENESLRGSTYYENNWLLGSIVAKVKALKIGHAVDKLPEAFAEAEDLDFPDAPAHQGGKESGVGSAEVELGLAALPD